MPRDNSTMVSVDGSNEDNELINVPPVSDDIAEAPTESGRLIETVCNGAEHTRNCSGCLDNC